jgi:uncharacterized protein
MNAEPSAGAPPPPRRCPLCKKAASVRYRPFCSKRCADLDLGRWLGEVYRIPSQRVDEEDAAEDGPEDESSIKGTPRRPFDEPDDETP